MSKGRDVLVDVEAKAGRAFPHLRAARARTLEKVAEIGRLLDGRAPEGTSVVVFGSLARGEYTAGSDVDWTLLIDGPAHEGHYAAAQGIAGALQAAGFGAPGPSGVFGNVAFSHPLLHQIGGQEDTNKITTQRILLLLESKAIGDDAAYERVLRLVSHRYIDEDRGIRFSRSPEIIPKFLINDIVRYWRTVAVDFVSKQRERSDGWALRNTKLRLSRKLIFASGLLTCFSYARAPEQPWILPDGGRSIPAIVSFLREQIRSSPLEQLGLAALGPTVSSDTALGLFTPYDEFLGLLDDPERRNHLKRLPLDDNLGRDPVFRRASELGRAFQDALDRLMFDEDRDLARLIRAYGVF